MRITSGVVWSTVVIILQSIQKPIVNKNNIVTNRPSSMITINNEKNSAVQVSTMPKRTIDVV
jgi:hypothetical protein